MEEKVFFKNSKGDRLCGILASPTNDRISPVIVMIHGSPLSDKNSATNVALTKRLNEKNIAGFRFDLFGHGESGGRYEDLTVEEAVDDANRAVSFLKKLGYRKIGFFGSSYGGEVALIAAADNAPYVLALRCPVANFPAARKIKAPTLIVHGDKDDQVPIGQSLKLAKLIPGCQMEAVKGAGHYFEENNSRQTMIDYFVNFIAGHSR